MSAAPSLSCTSHAEEDHSASGMSQRSGDGLNLVNIHACYLVAGGVQVAMDLERLKLIKERREQQRLERIKLEGWDRFAPISDTNKPPDNRPPDHPDFKAKD
jgi:hypothetical protein